VVQYEVTENAGVYVQISINTHNSTQVY